jgi:hypothetical protein
MRSRRIHCCICGTLVEDDAGLVGAGFVHFEITPHPSTIASPESSVRSQPGPVGLDLCETCVGPFLQTLPEAPWREEYVKNVNVEKALRIRQSRERRNGQRDERR